MNKRLTVFVLVFVVIASIWWSKIYNKFTSTLATIKDEPVRVGMSVEVSANVDGEECFWSAEKLKSAPILTAHPDGIEWVIFRDKTSKAMVGACRLSEKEPK